LLAVHINVGFPLNILESYHTQWDAKNPQEETRERSRENGGNSDFVPTTKGPTHGW
jgi:hypothetical protein